MNTNRNICITIFLSIFLISCKKESVTQTVTSVDTIAQGTPVIDTTGWKRYPMDVFFRRTIAFPQYYSANDTIKWGEDSWSFQSYRSDGKVNFYFGSDGSARDPFTPFTSFPDTFVQAVPTIPNPTYVRYPLLFSFSFKDSLMGKVYCKNGGGSFRNMKGIVLIQNPPQNNIIWVLRVDFNDTLRNEVNAILRSIRFQ